MVVEHWFDFVCPYRYVAQDRNRILRAASRWSTRHPHPSRVPPGGIAGPPGRAWLEIPGAGSRGRGLSRCAGRPGCRTRVRLWAAFDGSTASAQGPPTGFAESVFAAYFAMA